MSKVPIWSWLRHRSELGGATKGTIYLSKALIGLAFALPILLMSHSVLAAFVAGTEIVLVEKVCWYLNKGFAPEWDDYFDWVCDLILAQSWWVFWLLFLSPHLWIGLGVLAVFTCVYPFSCE